MKYTTIFPHIPQILFAFSFNKFSTLVQRNMLVDKIILIFGVIFAIFFSSINCDGTEETSMKSLVKEMKKFLTKIQQLDDDLKLPESFKNFKDVRKHFRWGLEMGHKIVNKKEHLDRFKEEYEKFVRISENCIDEYLNQIDRFAHYYHRNIGNQHKRGDLLKYYDDEFLKKMKINDAENSGIEKPYKELENKLTQLREKIAALVDLPPPPPMPQTVKPGKDKKSKDHSVGDAAAAGFVIGTVASDAMNEGGADEDGEGSNILGDIFSNLLGL